MKIISMVGAVVAGLMAVAAQAETVRYTFDQAFWGIRPTGQDAATWQAGRDAAVAANPGDFRYMTGSFNFDTLYGLPTNVSLTVDYGPVSHTFVSSGPYSDPRFTATREERTSPSSRSASTSPRASATC